MSRFILKNLSTATFALSLIFSLTSIAREAAPKNVAPAKDASKETARIADSTEQITGSAEIQEIAEAAVAKPVSADPVQLFGWRENIHVNEIKDSFIAKLDTGARTSSIHAEQKEMFERDGKKWMRFVLTDPTVEKSVRVRVEAPLVRIVYIKEPGGISTPREVVILSIKIGGRKVRGEFTLNNRNNMLAPVLIGRSMLKELGWVDPARTHLAEKKIYR